MQDLKEIATKLKDKIDKIKVMAFDIDGVLTTGHIWYSENEGFNRFSHTSDGYGLKILEEVKKELDAPEITPTLYPALIIIF